MEKGVAYIWNLVWRFRESRKALKGVLMLRPLLWGSTQVGLARPYFFSFSVLSPPRLPQKLLFHHPSKCYQLSGGVQEQGWGGSR